jgi:hypothetical protein
VLVNRLQLTIVDHEYSPLHAGLIVPVDTRLDATSDRNSPKLRYEMGLFQITLKQNNGVKLKRNMLTVMAHSVNSLQLLPCPDVVGANSLALTGSSIIGLDIRNHKVQFYKPLNCTDSLPVLHGSSIGIKGPLSVPLSPGPQCSITDSATVLSHKVLVNRRRPIDGTKLYHRII